VSWSVDGQNIYYLSTDGARDLSHVYEQNLWVFSLSSGKSTQLTQGINITGYTISPNKNWLSLDGQQLYEKSEDNFGRDIWLLNDKENSLLKITGNQGDMAVAGFSPDGTRLVIWRSKLPPLIFSLENGSSTLITFDTSADYLIGGAK
jgi:Tol biopolymer transport system component